MNKTLKLFLYSLPLILLDSIAKTLAKGQTIIIKNFFGVRYATNTGTSFSLLQNHNLLLIFITIFAVLAMFVYFKKFKGYGFFAVVLITAGGIGNLLDRVFLGYVRDFIYIKFWPTIFNFADVFLTVGVVLLIIYMFKKEH